MKTLYLECNSGISGDMTVAALLDLGADENALRAGLASMNVDGYKLSIGRVKKAGIDACDFNVILDSDAHEHHHDSSHSHDQSLHGHHDHHHEEHHDHHHEEHQNHHH
jgi:uncharacterized protein (DUF111 family)